MEVELLMIANPQRRFYTTGDSQSTIYLVVSSSAEEEQSPTDVVASYVGVR